MKRTAVIYLALALLPKSSGYSKYSNYWVFGTNLAPSKDLAVSLLKLLLGLILSKKGCLNLFRFWRLCSHLYLLYC